MAKKALPKKKPKILLIEDDQILAGMYLDKFREAGFEAKLASEVREALALTEKERPDLVVLDILLPRENGLFFLEKLRKNPKIADMPVLAFSNYDDPQTKRKALELGVLDYLIKTDYTPRDLIKKVRNCLTAISAKLPLKF